MIEFERVKPGMILIASDSHMYTVMHVSIKSQRHKDYKGFMITNKPRAGFTLFGKNRYVTDAYHEELEFDEITEEEKSNYYEWLFEWIFIKGLKDIDIS